MEHVQMVDVKGEKYGILLYYTDKQNIYSTLCGLTALLNQHDIASNLNMLQNTQAECLQSF